MLPSNHLREAGERIEALLAELGALADPRAREKAEELVRLLVETYGEGLARMVEIAGPETLDRFAEDMLVSSLLVLHGLHPLDTETRVRQALDRLRPFGQIQILELGAAAVQVRAEAGAPGLRAAIERVLEEAAPEVTRVEVVGLAEPAAPLVQISLGARTEGVP
jgi:hypothetical protein